MKLTEALQYWWKNVGKSPINLPKDRIKYFQFISPTDMDCRKYVNVTRNGEMVLKNEMRDLQWFKDKEQSSYQQNIEQLRQEFEESLHCERASTEERVAEIMADCEMERTRVERAERRIEKLGRDHRNEIDDLKSKFSRDTEDLLPKSVQSEFECTIDALHGELKDLRKTVKTLMASNQRKFQLGDH